MSNCFLHLGGKHTVEFDCISSLKLSNKKGALCDTTFIIYC